MANVTALFSSADLKPIYIYLDYRDGVPSGQMLYLDVVPLGTRRWLVDNMDMYCDEIINATSGTHKFELFDGTGTTNAIRVVANYDEFFNFARGYWMCNLLESHPPDVAAMWEYLRRMHIGYYYQWETWIKYNLEIRYQNLTNADQDGGFFFDWYFLDITGKWW